MSWAGEYTDLLSKGVIIWRPVFGEQPPDALCPCGRSLTYIIGDSCGHYGWLAIHADGDRSYSGRCHAV